MVVAFVGLGSNLSEPVAQVESAIADLQVLPHSKLRARSSLYRTTPWGGVAQPDFVNAVVELETTLPARTLMDELLAIERRLGRRRAAQRYGPRVIDLDLLMYGDVVIDEPGLRVPHPRLHERAFVLVPLAEIAPAASIPQQGSVAAALAVVDTASCARL
ncbi:MAG: 2-amino-4-hydroxy-6-hydroxymethyldihydropteridine diphosphokinase [Rudaea sp.]